MTIRSTRGTASTGGAVEENRLRHRRGTGDVFVRAARPRDVAALVRMRRALWPDGSAAEHRSELVRFFAGRSRNPLGILVAETPAWRVIGFAEVSIRRYAEDCRTDRVGFLEGWWVEPVRRRRGVGRLLVEAAEGWARRRRCVEFASDSLPGNRGSIAAHRALGFADAGTIVCFRKDLARRKR